MRALVVNKVFPICYTPAAVGAAPQHQGMSCLAPGLEGPGQGVTEAQFLRIDPTPNEGRQFQTFEGAG